MMKCDVCHQEIPLKGKVGKRRSYTTADIPRMPAYENVGEFCSDCEERLTAAMKRSREIEETTCAGLRRHVIDREIEIIRQR